MKPDDFHASKYAVDADTGCWVWHAAWSSGGYGRVLHAGRLWQAHRAFYDHFIGPIPDEMVVHHCCQRRACVNPMHLKPVSRNVNVQIGRASKLDRRAVRRIRFMAKSGMTYREIASHFGIDERAASFVARRLMWRNVA